MKKMIILAAALLCVFGLIASFAGDSGSGIGTKYKNMYSSEGLEINDYNNEDQHYISFNALSGNYVCRFKKTTDGDGEINYTAFIKSGELKIYYDSQGKKELLATITPGETVIASGGYVQKGRRAYIIIEATEALDGYVYINF